MRVRVYYNIRKHCLSVMDKATRRIIQHVDGITLKDVKFIVSQKGVGRIRRNNRKAVVAFVEGTVIVEHAMCLAEDVFCHAITFNPYKYTTFVMRQTQTQVDSAEYVTIKGREILALGAK